MIRTVRRPARATGFAAAFCAAVVVAAITGAGPAFADATPSPTDTSPLLQPTADSAMLNLLGEQGVAYDPTTSAAEALSLANADATLVIDEGESFDPSQAQTIADAGFGRVVILNEDQNTVNAFFSDVTIGKSSADTSSLDPSCDEPDAEQAGPIALPGTSTTFVLSDSNAVGCYPAGGVPTVVYGTQSVGDAVIVGSAAFYENDNLTDSGNAALALHLFGAHHTLVWLAPSFVPDPSLNNCDGQGCGGQQQPQPGSTTTIPAGGGGGSGASQATLTSLMPTWIWWVLLQLLVAILLTAYWRGRRLGAVVTEQLPVTVRAAETVEGHARLYRRANAHGRAAELLRKATASRLAGYFGIPAARASADPSLLIAPIAARLNAGEDLIADLLAGEAPQSEAELVLLADHLDQLEQEVRSS